MKKNIAVILCGCGFKDGSEIHESVSSLLAIDQAGAQYQCFAPTDLQPRVINHLTMQPEVENKRLMLTEAARIARGNIKSIKELNVDSFDALILPGGFGAATNLCNFAEKGADCQVHPEVERVVIAFHAIKKPIGFICIAPAIAARVLGKNKVELTIGNDPQTSALLEKMGARHFNKAVDQIHIDQLNLVVSTPAYMLANRISEVYQGVSKLVDAVIAMTK